MIPSTTITTSIICHQQWIEAQLPNVCCCAMQSRNFNFQILSSDDPHYREQSPSGDRFKVDSDYFVFRTRSVAVEFLVSIKFFFSKKKCFSWNGIHFKDFLFEKPKNKYLTVMAKVFSVIREQNFGNPASKFFEICKRRFILGVWVGDKG